MIAIHTSTYLTVVRPLTGPVDTGDALRAAIANILEAAPGCVGGSVSFASPHSESEACDPDPVSVTPPRMVATLMPDVSRWRANVAPAVRTKKSRVQGGPIHP